MFTTVYLLLDVLFAFILDLIFGDPYWLPHPVRFIGWLIKKTESVLRGLIKKSVKSNYLEEDLNKKERYAGLILTMIVVLTTFFSVMLILKLADLINPILFHVLNTYFIYSAIATQCLATEAKKVFIIVKNNNIQEARKALSMLVGRETENLNEQEVIRGVIETTAENTVDGIMSPIIYAVIGSLFGLGAPLVYAFKAISTLDSMVGYMNEKYINLGRFSAKTDDVANYLPARISGVLIPFSALLCRMNAIKSFSIMLRDRHNHKSPNCAYPEAAFAGALGIKLGGTNIYFGQAVEKPTIGDADKEIVSEDILKAIRLMYTVSIITLVLSIGVALTIDMFNI